MKLKTQLIAITFASFIISWGCGNGKLDNATKDSEVKTGESDKQKERQGDYEEGLSLYNTHCEDCHNPPHRHMLDGFQWDGIMERLPNGERYFIEYIRSSSTLRNDSDAYALRIKELFKNNQFEHEFGKKLSPEELKSLMVYIKTALEKSKRGY